MTWEDVLKMHCGGNREKMTSGRDDEKEFEKLTGKQKEIDVNNNDKIDEGDFRILRRRRQNEKNKISKRELKEGNTTISHDECKNIEKEILAINDKEGGAMSFKKNVLKELKGKYGSKKLRMVVEDMIKRKTLSQHEMGDLYTNKPSKGRGFTA